MKNSLTSHVSVAGREPLRRYPPVGKVDSSQEAGVVVCFYQELEAGKQAKRVADKIVGAMRQAREVHLNLWSFPALRLPVVWTEAIGNARNASVVVVSAHSANEIPAAIQIWFQRWASVPCEPNERLLVGVFKELRDSDRLTDASRAQEAREAGENQSWLNDVATRAQARLLRGHWVYAP